jgi:hypothetical protein
MVGDRAANDATPDDDNAGVTGQFGHMSSFRFIVAFVVILFAASPALAEVCDKIDPSWTRGERPWPPPALLVFCAVVGLVAGALSALSGRIIVLGLSFVPLVLVRLLDDASIVRAARAEGCMLEPIPDALVLLGSTAIPAIVLYLVLTRGSLRR